MVAPLTALVLVLLSSEYPMDVTAWEEHCVAFAVSLKGEPTVAPLEGALTAIPLAWAGAAADEEPDAGLGDGDGLGDGEGLGEGEEVGAEGLGLGEGEGGGDGKAAAAAVAGVTDLPPQPVATAATARTSIRVNDALFNEVIRICYSLKEILCTALYLRRPIPDQRNAATPSQVGRIFLSSCRDCLANARGRLRQRANYCPIAEVEVSWGLADPG